MILNTGIYIQCKITERIGLLFLPDSIRENTRSHNKKENDKKNTTNH